MIALLQKGDYRLIETKAQVKILYLDDQVFGWVHVKAVGEILVATHTPHHADYLLATGRFRLYQAEDDPKYASGQHLELHVGASHWQGYLIPAGLPTATKVRSLMVPIGEVISRTA